MSEINFVSHSTLPGEKIPEAAQFITRQLDPGLSSSLQGASSQHATNMDHSQPFCSTAFKNLSLVFRQPTFINHSSWDMVSIPFTCQPLKMNKELLSVLLSEIWSCKKTSMFFKETCLRTWCLRLDLKYLRRKKIGMKREKEGGKKGRREGKRKFKQKKKDKTYITKFW